MVDALASARRFAEQYRGSVAGLDPAALATALDELADIRSVLHRVSSYAHLRTAVDATDDDNRDLAARIERDGVDMENLLRFLDLEWQAIDGAVARRTAADSALTRYRHHLDLLTDDAAHILSEAEERILSERSTAAVTEWQKLFGETVSTLTTQFDVGDGAREHTLDELLAYMHHSNRDVRIRALETLYAMLTPWTPVLAKCYDTLVGDRLTVDKLRSYADPIQPANIANDLSDAVVDGLITAVEERYPLAQRWFRHKAKMMGLPVLALADQYAPLGEGRHVQFEEGRTLLQSAIERFSPEVWKIIDGAFEGNRIDAEPRPGKRGGAFCAPVSSHEPPFVLMNYTDSLDDVDTLAHEMGHYIHFWLAGQAQTELTFGTGMAMAEVASTFNEMLVFDLLMETETDPGTRRAIVAERVEGSFATVFRQTMMARYEKLAYALRAGGSALSSDRLCDIWFEQNKRYYGDSIELPQGYRYGWAYIPHFIDTRFYTYSYAFAHLTSLALYAKYREQGASFVEPYIAFLSAGGSETPAESLAKLGIDISDPGWVEPGFAEIERMLEIAEAN